LTFWSAAAAVGAILIAVFLAGLTPAGALLPPGPRGRAERAGWSLLLGAALLSLQSALGLLLGFAPGWISFLIVAAFAALLSLAGRRRTLDPDSSESSGNAAGRRGRGILTAAVVAGIALYSLRALTEPMWSNDFLAIWGLKGKVMYLARTFPSRLLPESLYGFSHPEYPLGLPLCFAGLASLLGRWDDHALALLFPALQIATLGVLFGWLRRREISWAVAGSAAALLAWFEPLYSGFLTGLAEVPLAAALLLFGTAYSDSLEGETRAAIRLAAASLLAGFLKNEGIFLAVAGGLAAGLRRRWTTAAAALFPAIAAAAVGRVASRGAALRDFDSAFLGPRAGELPARAGETVRAALAEPGLWGWAALGCLVFLFLAGQRTPFADRLLILGGVCFLLYLLAPIFAVRGPSWLVQTTLARTSAALAPLAAAGLAGRFRSR
jgi:hypothetical protein